MSQRTITQAIHEKLAATQSAGSVHALAGGRVFHLRAPMETPLPWVRFTLAQDQAQAYFGQSGEDIETQLVFEVWHDAHAGAAAAQAINDALHAQLHRQTLDVPGLTDVQIFCLSRGVPELDASTKAIRIRSTWRIWASAS